jgi:hypothetical protein
MSSPFPDARLTTLDRQDYPFKINSLALESHDSFTDVQ